MAVWIIAVIIALVVIWIVIWVYIAKKNKWTLKIEISKDDFASWETIKGSLSLLAKKPIQWNKLWVKLVCYEEVTRRDPDGYSNTQKRVLRDKTVNIEEQRGYMPGYNKSYPRKLQIPIKEWQDTTNSTFGKVLSVISRFTGNQKNIYRALEARLDAKGLDLTDSQKLYIHDLS